MMDRKKRTMSGLLENKWLLSAAVLGAVVVASGACSQQASSAPPVGQAGTDAVSSAGAVGTVGTGATNSGGGATSVGTTTGGAGTSIAGTTSIAGSTGVVGTGGAVAAAGATGASAGAGGASAAVVKLCATKVTAASTQIADFETFTGTTTVDKFVFAFAGPTNGTAGVYGGAYGYAGGTDAVTLAILAGHTGNYGLTESTTPATSWGQGLGFWMGCVNASAYKGVTFWVRGTVPSGVFSFALNMESTTLPDMTNPAGGGTCPGTSDTCVAPAKSGIPISMDWTQVSVAWADLTGGLSGTTAVTATGDTMTGMTLQMDLTYANPDDAGYTAVAGDISFAIDDIAFMP
jgi:collagen type VII alpha